MIAALYSIFSNNFSLPQISEWTELDFPLDVQADAALYLAKHQGRDQFQMARDSQAKDSA